MTDKPDLDVTVPGAADGVYNWSDEDLDMLRSIGVKPPTPPRRLSIRPPADGHDPIMPMPPVLPAQPIRQPPTLAVDEPLHPEDLTPLGLSKRGVVLSQGLTTSNTVIAPLYDDDTPPAGVAVFLLLLETCLGYMFWSQIQFFFFQHFAMRIISMDMAYHALAGTLLLPLLFLIHPLRRAFARIYHLLYLPGSAAIVLHLFGDYQLIRMILASVGAGCMMIVLTVVVELRKASRERFAWGLTLGLLVNVSSRLVFTSLEPTWVSFIYMVIVVGTFLVAMFVLLIADCVVHRRYQARMTRVANLDTEQKLLDSAVIPIANELKPMTAKSQVSDPGNPNANRENKRALGRVDYALMLSSGLSLGSLLFLTLFLFTQSSTIPRLSYVGLSTFPLQIGPIAAWALGIALTSVLQTPLWWYIIVLLAGIATALPIGYGTNVSIGYLAVAGYFALVVVLPLVWGTTLQELRDLRERAPVAVVVGAVVMCAWICIDEATVFTASTLNALAALPRGIFFWSPMAALLFVGLAQTVRAFSSERDDTGRSLWYSCWCPHKKCAPLAVWLTLLIFVGGILGVAIAFRVVRMQAPQLAPSASATDGLLTVSTYSVQHGVSNDGRVSFEPLAVLLRQTQAGVMALQEAPPARMGTSQRDLVGWLADVLGMTAGPDQLGLWSSRVASGQFLTSLPLGTTAANEIQFTFNNTLIAAIVVNIDPYLTDAAASAAINTVAFRVQSLSPMPTIVLGNFNAGVSSTRISILQAQGMQSAYHATHSGVEQPTTQTGTHVDLVMYKNLHAVSTAILSTSVADATSIHYPVIAKFRTL
eukprot:TRINITY_DN482_c0_g1_i1.p1 TRINITY_DN482_c0_g1~~TRINITY_DN482_c0_g1_i1.p1  ORF type:complete len:816 (+),score=169.70 TRINITY_DN482_c0_g1_i1:113-2560(+)